MTKVVVDLLQRYLMEIGRDGDSDFAWTILRWICLSTIVSSDLKVWRRNEKITWNMAVIDGCCTKMMVAAPWVPRQFWLGWSSLFLIRVWFTPWQRMCLYGGVYGGRMVEVKDPEWGEWKFGHKAGWLMEECMGWTWCRSENKENKITLYIITQVRHQTMTGIKFQKSYLVNLHSCNYFGVPQSFSWQLVESGTHYLFLCG